MKLSELIHPEHLIDSNLLQACDSVEVTSITADSRQVTEGSLFIAVLGAKFDANVFINDAFSRGACAVVYSGTITVQPNGLAIPVHDARRALSFAASQFFGDPSLKLQNIAITGTSGKTSVSWILSHALVKLNSPTFIGGSLGFKLIENGENTVSQLKELSNTTMDPISVHQFLADALGKGAKASVFEATSQGIVHSRMRDVAWDGAIYTNLTREHMDLHGTMERYEAAKRELFVTDLVESPKKKKFAIFNFDDQAARRVGFELKATHPEILVVGFSRTQLPQVDFVIDKLNVDTRGLSFCLKGKDGEIEIKSNLVGIQNAYNLSCAALALKQLGYDNQSISLAVADTPVVPGRLEPIPNARVATYVDYAHKADALEKALLFLKPLCKGRLICVFGCGGDRDTGKRPIMGEISHRIADLTIITSDNPRTEVPEDIVEAVASGIEDRSSKKYMIEVDRRKAIFKAVELAGPDDIILIAGKGHEPYQEIHGVKHPFHDVLVAKEALGL